MMYVSSINFQPNVKNNGLCFGNKKEIAKRTTEIAKDFALPTTGTLAAMVGINKAVAKDNVPEAILPQEIKNMSEMPGYEKALASIDPTKTKVTAHPVCTAYEYDHYEKQETRYEFFDSNNKPIMTQKVTTYDTWRSTAIHDQAITIFYNDDNGHECMADGKGYNNSFKINRVVTFNHNNETMNNKEIVDGQLIDVNNKSVSGRGFTLYAKDENGNIIIDHYNFEGDRNRYSKYSHSTPYTDNPNGYGIKAGDTSYNLYEDAKELPSYVPQKSNGDTNCIIAKELKKSGGQNFSLYANNENGCIIADHYKAGKYSHSTPYKEGGYGIVADESTKF